MNRNLQKPEGINLLRKYLHKHIISLFGDLLCTGWRVYYADSNERKIKICKQVLYYNCTIYCRGSGKFVVPQGTCMRSDAFPLYKWSYVHMGRLDEIFCHTAQELHQLLPMLLL